MREPWACSMNRGVPPTPRNARTGELTPPGMTSFARSKNESDCLPMRAGIIGCESIDAGDSIALLRGIDRELADLVAERCCFCLIRVIAILRRCESPSLQA